MYFNSKVTNNVRNVCLRVGQVRKCSEWMESMYDKNATDTHIAVINKKLTCFKKIQMLALFRKM